MILPTRLFSESSIMGLQTEAEYRNNIKEKGLSACPTCFLQEGTKKLLWISCNSYNSLDIHTCMVFSISSIPKLIWSSPTDLRVTHKIQYPQQSGYLLTKNVLQWSRSMFFLYLVLQTDRSTRDWDVAMSVSQRLKEKSEHPERMPMCVSSLDSASSERFR